MPDQMYAFQLVWSLCSPRWRRSWGEVFKMPRPSSPLQARSCKSGDWISSYGFWRLVQCVQRSLWSVANCIQVFTLTPPCWGSTYLTQIILPCYFLFIQTGCILASQKVAVKRSQSCWGHISSFHVINCTWAATLSKSACTNVNSWCCYQTGWNHAIPFSRC